MLKKQFEILLQFVKEPWKKFTFKDVKKFTRKKSESYIYDSLKEFVKKDILIEEKAGNVILYSIHIKKLKTQMYDVFMNTLGLSRANQPRLTELH